MPEKSNEKEAVSNLQRYLRQISYYDKRVSAPPIDGIYESATVRSVREFQQSKGLPVTGVVDQETWELLYRSYRALLSLIAPPRQISVFPFLPDNYELKRGDVGFVVSSIQYMLRELGAQYRDVTIPDATGVFDQQTEAAVIEFQKRNVLQPDGAVSKQDWNAIADQYNTMATHYSGE